MRSTWESSSSRGRYTARELKPTSPHPPKRFLRLRILEDKGIITLRNDGNFSERHSVLYQRTWTFTVMLFLGSHAILREATFSFVMSVRPHVSSRLLPYGLPWNLYLKFFFPKSAEESHVLFKYDKNNGYFVWRPIHIYGISLSSSWRAKCFRKSLSINIFPETCFIWSSVGKTRNTLSRFHCNNGHTHQKVTCTLNIRFHLSLGLPNVLFRSGFANKLFSHLRNSRSVPHR